MLPESITVYNLIQTAVQNQPETRVYLAEVKDTIDGPVVKRIPLRAVLGEDGTLLLVKEDDLDTVTQIEDPEDEENFEDEE